MKSRVYALKRLEARRYKDRRPHEAVETEALRQTVLQDILPAHFDALLPGTAGAG
jgi:hypothetical protein